MADVETAGLPRISVVVATVQDGAALPGALRALESQIGAPPFEVIVPVDSSVPGTEALETTFGGVRLVAVAGTAVLARSADIGARHLAIDRRRSAGLGVARGDIVALTDEYARPDRDWCARLAELHDELPHAVIGGAIENSNDRVVNQALFLADTGRYQNPLPEGPASFVSDVNVSYKRGPLFDIQDVWGDAYNETGVHDALRRSGHVLWLSPRLVVRLDRGRVTARHALRESFAWARLYAARRTRDAGAATRFLLALASPLLAPLLLMRQARTALNGRRAGPFIRCLPLLLVIDIMRAAGEWVGYVTGRETAG